SCSTAHASTLCLRLEHCRCALWLGILTLVSNGESKIAIFKARLCYGFAIALRALFLVILRFYCHCEAIAKASKAATKESSSTESMLGHLRFCTIIPKTPNPKADCAQKTPFYLAWLRQKSCR
ncbi:MAG: hypothetical protein K2N69_07740, partial [Helicobacter sp.]|nr:hypothetical protein [Helicobacter sp.]